MNKLLDIFQQWPPINQLIFLVILLLASFVLVFVLGWWLRSLLSEILHAVSVWVRGWPPVPGTVTQLPPEPAHFTLEPPPPVWRQSRPAPSFEISLFPVSSENSLGCYTKDTSRGLM